MSMTETCARPAARRNSSISFLTRFSLWRSRRALARLDAEGLADVGLSERQARQEAALTIWDVPDSWKSR